MGETEATVPVAPPGTAGLAAVEWDQYEKRKRLASAIWSHLPAKPIGRSGAFPAVPETANGRPGGTEDISPAIQKIFGVGSKNHRKSRGF